MAGKIGRIDTFDGANETWQSYKERLDQFFLANDVKNEKKVPVLLSVIGGKTYTLLRDLTNPTIPGEETYDNLIKHLKDYFNPTPLQIAERFRFHKRDQHESESVREFNAAIRKLSEYCEFGAALTDSLRDRFVCGLRNENIQKKLLSEKALTYEKAYEMAIAMETATKDACELQQRAQGVHWMRNDKQVRKQRKGQGNKWKSREEKQGKKECIRCKGTNHKEYECRFKDAICHNCNKKGHIVKACLSKVNRPPKNGNLHRLDDSEDDDDEYEYMHSLEINELKKGKKHNDMIWLNPTIDGKNWAMELDTGSAVSIINKLTYDKYFNAKPLKESSIKVRTYSGEKIIPLGVIKVKVALNGQSAHLELYVVKQGGPPLFGRDWLRNIKLDWKSIKAISIVSKPMSDKPDVWKAVNKLQGNYAETFKDGLGTLRGIKANIKVHPDASAKFIKARSVPYALKEKVEKELDRLLENDILEKVEYSEWATPIVPIPKKDGTVRICGDFKVTVNQVLDVDQYPLPKIEDIFANLSQGQHFSKLDLRNAYLQMEVQKNDRKFLTINTHRGLFRYKRLVFGIASAPAIWQRAMDQVLQGIPGVQCILDDMIITGATTAQHLENLETVLKRLQDYGLRLHQDKCEFFKERIQFCGHIIDKEGLHKTQEKVEAVVNSPPPENVSQLRSFLGLVNYYGKFISNLSATVQPLNQLLEVNRKWNWSAKCKESFKKVKEAIASDQVLTHYDPAKKVKLATDASPYGLGAVLSHVMEDGSERPIAFASKSLSKAEKNYSQIDKEALGIVWGVKKFQHYLFGRHFLLFTDHQPLTSIFSPEKGISVTTAARLQRYALYLAGFQYDIKYRNTSNHANADSLSRLPLEAVDNDSDEMDAIDMYMVSHIEVLPVTSKHIVTQTLKDPLLQFSKDGLRRTRFWDHTITVRLKFQCIRIVCFGAFE